MAMVVIVMIVMLMVMMIVIVMVVAMMVVVMIIVMLMAVMAIIRRMSACGVEGYFQNSNSNTELLLIMLKGYRGAYKLPRLSSH